MVGGTEKGIGIISAISPNIVYSDSIISSSKTSQNTTDPIISFNYWLSKISHIGWALRPVVFITIVHVLTEGMSSA
jgi:hypothetical protein